MKFHMFTTTTKCVKQNIVFSELIFIYENAYEICKCISIFQQGNNNMLMPNNNILIILKEKGKSMDSRIVKFRIKFIFKGGKVQQKIELGKVNKNF